MRKLKHNNNNDHQNHELLTVREVSAILRVDGTTIRRWVKNGALEAVTLPHLNKRMAYRIKRETVHNLLNQHTA
jgi:excisionase family DNA binding protein